jgi:excisionase family DNA binding protein
MMPSTPQATPKLAFTIREAATASGLSRSTLYVHIGSGRLKANRVGGRTLITMEALRALIDGREA